MRIPYMQNTLKLRALVSTVLLLTFVLAAFTGVGLYLSPSGRVANEIGWTFMGITKHQLETLHTVSGFLMSAIVGIHLILNWNMFVNEVKAAINM